jgi:hypothetical protein
VLEHQRPLIRYDARRGALRPDIGANRIRGRRVAAVSLGEHRPETVGAPGFGDLASQRADALAERERSRHELAVPERHPRRYPGGRIDDHPVMLDRRDSPGGRSELEHIADARLVDELLVQLAEPRPVGKVHRVEAAVRNRSARDHRGHSARARAAETVIHAIPCDPRLELRGQIRWVFAGEHREHFIERATGQPMVRVGRPDHPEQIAR